MAGRGYVPSACRWEGLVGGLLRMQSSRLRRRQPVDHESNRVRSRTIKTAASIATAVLLLSLCSARAASPRPASSDVAAAASAPRLGVASIARNGAGFGEVKPQEVSYGGDPTSFVSKVRWVSWGGARAVGHGIADWVWPGWCVACGSVELPATVVAFGRSTCQGHSAYSRLEWYFPSRGMSFSRRLGGNICNADSTPAQPPFKEAKCASVSLPTQGSMRATAEDIATYDSPITCATARQFVAGSGAGRYLNRNARFTHNGWWCGSELSMELGGPQSFTCVQGDFTNVTFYLQPTGG
jgi:hypothetical protein